LSCGPEKSALVSSFLNRSSHADNSDASFILAKSFSNFSQVSTSSFNSANSLLVSAAFLLSNQKSFSWVKISNSIILFFLLTKSKTVRHLAGFVF